MARCITFNSSRSWNSTEIAEDAGFYLLDNEPDLWDSTHLENSSGNRPAIWRLSRRRSDFGSMAIVDRQLDGLLIRGGRAQSERGGQCRALTLMDLSDATRIAEKR